MSMTIEGFVGQFRGDLAATVIPDDPEFQQAAEFKKGLEPNPEVSHEWVYNYAVAAFERSSKNFDRLDDKASDIIKYLGGGTGLLTLAAVSSMTKANAGVYVWALPSFILAVGSIYCAVLARKPNETAEPPSVKVAYRFAEAYGVPQEGEDLTKATERAKSSFLGEWHLAVVGMDIAVKGKAGKVKWATWFYFWAIAFLGAPLVVAWYRL